MPYTTANDWLERFDEANCRLEVDVTTMRRAKDRGSPATCDRLWSEIQGPENKAKWDEVWIEVRLRVGPFTGSTYYP
jgi:hypothetical protein